MKESENNYVTEYHRNVWSYDSKKYEKDTWWNDKIKEAVDGI